MPIYEFVCMKCESHFEELLRTEESDPACPDCGASNVARQFSVFAASGTAEQTRASAAWPEAAAVAAGAVAAVDTQDRALTRRAALADYARETAACTRCRLAEGRAQVVFGVGNPDADLMFVGEAPGFHEDKQGFPFVGQAGKLLDKLLAGIGLTRDDVYVANVIKCRPPGNRDPMQDEIEACESHLFKQIEFIEPRLVATLGNFATKLLSGKSHGITRVHGAPQEATVGGRVVTLYPIYHPAAALYTPAMLQTLEEDFARIPVLLSTDSSEQNRSPDNVVELPVVAAPVEPAQEQLDFSRDPGRAVCVLELESFSHEDTERIAATLANHLSTGDVVTVAGELGTGKTTFIRGACRALGVTSPVTSPTFTIGQRYAGTIAVSHLDLYRLSDLTESDWGDVEPYFDDAAVFVEWPEAAREQLLEPRAAVVCDTLGTGID